MSGRACARSAAITHSNAGTADGNGRPPVYDPDELAVTLHPGVGEDLQLLKHAGALRGRSVSSDDAVEHALARRGSWRDPLAQRIPGELHDAGVTGAGPGLAGSAGQRHLAGPLLECLIAHQLGQLDPGIDLLRLVAHGYDCAPSSRWRLKGFPARAVRAGGRSGSAGRSIRP